MCTCSVPAGLMVTVLGEAKKKEKLKDHYRLGQVSHICASRNRIACAFSKDF